MPRQRSPDREKAEQMYLEAGGNIDLVDIARELNRPAGTIRGWKNKDQWDAKLNGTFQKKSTERSKREKRKKGAQPGNKNAVGHGAPPKNKNAEKHGLFSKYLPEETMELVEELQREDDIARIKRNIAIQEAAIIRAQGIMHVESKEELIKHLKKVQSSDKGSLKEWEFQYAWDRQGNFLNSLSKAMTTLMSMYKTLAELKPEGDDVDNAIEDFVDALNNTAEETWGDKDEEE